jgi:hypothetical protein
MNGRGVSNCRAECLRLSLREQYSDSSVPCGCCHELGEWFCSNSDAVMMMMMMMMMMMAVAVTMIKV